MNVEDIKKKYYAELEMLDEELQKLEAQKASFLKSSEESADASKSFKLEMEAVEVIYQATFNKYKNYKRFLSYVESVCDVIDMMNKQDSEAIKKDVEDITKIVEVARRISINGIVPESDEERLKAYSMELYLSSKDMALVHKTNKQEEYKSLWD